MASIDSRMPVSDFLACLRFWRLNYEVEAFDFIGTAQAEAGTATCDYEEAFRTKFIKDEDVLPAYCLQDAGGWAYKQALKCINESKKYPFLHAEARNINLICSSKIRNNSPFKQIMRKAACRNIADILEEEIPQLGNYCGDIFNNPETIENYISRFETALLVSDAMYYMGGLFLFDALI